MKLYLMIEAGELFECEAENMAEAEEFAEMYNAEVIKEIVNK
jgi:hypothetical protein